MRPLMFVWPYALVYWIVHVWAFAPEMKLTRAARKRLKAAGNTSRDAGSIGVILWVTGLAMIAAIPIAFIPTLRIPPPARVPAFWIGVALLIAGSLLRRHCFKVLGEWFTGDVQAKAEQPVVDRGAYRFVRHPSYSGGILMFTGIGLTLGHWLSVLLLIASTFVSYSYRIAVEERALSETIGEPYLAFMRTRKRFIPGVW